MTGDDYPGSVSMVRGEGRSSNQVQLESPEKRMNEYMYCSNPSCDDID